MIWPCRWTQAASLSVLVMMSCQTYPGHEEAADVAPIMGAAGERGGQGTNDTAHDGTFAGAQLEGLVVPFAKGDAYFMYDESQVVMLLSMLGADPGTHRLVLDAAPRCADLPLEPLYCSEEAPGTVGVITADRTGLASASVSLPVQEFDPGELVGQVVAVYTFVSRPPRIREMFGDEAADRRCMPIACGVIRAL